MPRKPRLHVPGGLYHVILRGNNRQNLFFSPADRQALNELVAKSSHRLRTQVHAFCWMSNHLHMAVQVADQPLSRMMQWVASRYAYYINRRLRRTGHVFERRYRAILVDADTYLLELVRYIHRNPVTANMVRDPIDYPWSGHRCYLGRETLEWVTTDWVLALFSSQLSKARRLYRQFVLDPDANDPPAEMLNGRDDDRRLAGENELLEEFHEADDNGLPAPSLDAIITDVCRRHGVAPAILARPGKQRKHARIRAEIACQATQSGAATLAEIARRFNRAESATYRTMTHYFARK